MKLENTIKYQYIADVIFIIKSEKKSKVSYEA